MASIDSTGDGRWKVRWWANGGQKSKTFRDHAAAKRFKASLEGDMINATWIDPNVGTVSVKEYGDKWLSRLVGLKPTTRHNRILALRNHIVAEFGDLPLTAVSTSAVNDWIAKSLTTHAASTIRHHTSVMYALFGAAVAEGLLRSNPVAGSVRIKEELREPRFLTLPEAWDLVDNAPQVIEAMVALSTFGGFRYGELSALRRQDIDLRRSTVKVERSASYVEGVWYFLPPKTKYSRRTVVLPRSVMELVAAHLEEFTPSARNSLVFGVNGHPFLRGNFCKHYWYPLRESVGQPGLRFHDLRHTFVSLWVSLGRNPKEVSRAAGHSSVAFTLDRYAHLFESDQEGLADALDALVAPGHAETRETRDGTCVVPLSAAEGRYVSSSIPRTRVTAAHHAPPTRAVTTATGVSRRVTGRDGCPMNTCG